MYVIVIHLGQLQFYNPFNWLWLDGFKNSDGNFSMSGILINEFFLNIVVDHRHRPLNTYYQDNCLVSSWYTKLDMLYSHPFPCDERRSIICRKIFNVNPNCRGGFNFVKKNTLDWLLDPSLKANKTRAIKYKKTALEDMMFRLNQTEAYTTLFSILWYSNFPCFEIKGVTSEIDGERAILRSCKWKGVSIPCSAIFTTFPTDRGMCCSFNIQAADSIFLSGTFTKQLKKMQVNDKNYSVIESKLPVQYKMNNEPKTSSGRNKGLVLILDAHSNLFAPGSVDTNFNGFMGLISTSSSFPLMIQQGFEIRAGQNNIIALSSTQIHADENLRDIKPKDRNCLFSDEVSDIKIHKQYSYFNCIFECSLFRALNHNNNSCIPWFMPSVNQTITICDPWESEKFLQDMVNDNSESECNYCLPDCSNTIYEPIVTTIPFSNCDFTNIGISPICNVNDDNLPQPTKFSAQVISEYLATRKGTVPTFLNKYASNARPISNLDYFTQTEATYDAYTKDIAMVEVYFRTSTVIQLGSQPMMTWVDYFSTVGGLLGLVLGMGIVSVVEIIWLLVRLCSHKFNLTQWIM